MNIIYTICLLMLATSCLGKALGDDHDAGIFGGKPVKITEVPFMARLSGGCGASIINKRFLITAGHCLEKKSSVIVGTDDIKKGHWVDIEQQFRHPNYTLDNNINLVDYDLAVIKLKKALVFGDNVKAIKIADSTLPKPGEMLQAIGFGLTDNYTLPKHLLKVDVPYVEYETCKKMNAAGGIVTKRIICAGGQGGKSACYGDSGGPLVYKGKLIGATSRGFSPSMKCAEKGYPDGYAYLPSMMDWVRDIMKNNP